MDFDRRTLLQGAAVAGGLLMASAGPGRAVVPRREPGWIVGKMTGAMAVVETLIQEGCECVFGIPGAQENELWDAMKTKGPAVPALHARVLRLVHGRRLRPRTGKPGVLCVVPGPA